MEVTGLVKHFRLRGGLLAKPRIVRAVDGVDLTIERGEIMGVVGESGCGKSTFARTLLRLYKPDSGSIRFDGQEIANASAATIRPLRRRLADGVPEPIRQPESAHDGRRHSGRAAALPSG